MELYHKATLGTTHTEFMAESEKPILSHLKALKIAIESLTILERDPD